MIRHLFLALAMALTLPGVALAADPTPAPAASLEPTLGAPCPPVEYINGVPVIPDNAPADCAYIQGGGLTGETPVSEDPCAPLSDGSVPEMCQSAPMPIDAPVDGPTDPACMIDENGMELCALYDTGGGPMDGALHDKHMADGGIRTSEIILAVLALLALPLGYLLGGRTRGTKSSTPDQQ